MKNKSLALWLTFSVGPLGLHRVYLRGVYDGVSRVLALLTLMGLYGLFRAHQEGLDDPWSWLLIPVLGFTLSGCALNAIVYGLMDARHWNARFNPTAAADDLAGQTNWFTVTGLATSLLVGTTILMATLAYSFQHYFEYQIEEAQAISQTGLSKKSED